MAPAIAHEMSPPSFSGIVALISDGNRAALSQLLAERTSFWNGALRFAANGEELKHAVTHASLVLIEGSRLAELAAAGRVREAPAASDQAAAGELGDAVHQFLERLPRATRDALRAALHAPRSWSVKRIAHAAGISTRQLVRQCAAANGAVPPKDLLLAARLAVAQGLLRGPRPLNTAALARACGWVDARSLRAALRRAGLASVTALARLSSGDASVSDFVQRVARRTPNEQRP